MAVPVKRVLTAKLPDAWWTDLVAGERNMAPKNAPESALVCSGLHTARMRSGGIGPTPGMVGELLSRGAAWYNYPCDPR